MVRSLRRMILREFAAIRLDAEGARGKEGSFQEGRKVPVIPASVRMNRDLVNNHHRSPLFFASVDSKGG